MPYTTASICLVCRCMTIQMGIARHNLEATTKILVGANSTQIEQDFLSKKASKEQGAVHPDFSEKAIRTCHKKQLAMSDDDYNRDLPTTQKLTILPGRTSLCTPKTTRTQRPATKLNP